MAVIELNPFKWGRARESEVVPVASAAIAPIIHPAYDLTAAQTAAQETRMTFLQHLGNVLKQVLHIGEESAVIAQPLIAAEFPQILPIYSSALGLATAAEASAATSTGTGPQKLAQVVTNLTPQIEAWAKQNGIVWDNAGITKWTSALVDTLNLIPAPTLVPVPTTSAPTPTT